MATVVKFGLALCNMPGKMGRDCGQSIFIQFLIEGSMGLAWSHELAGLKIERFLPSLRL